MSVNTTLGALLQDYEAQEITLLEPGRYTLEIVNVKPRQTDVMPTLKVVDGPYAGKRAMVGTISFNGNAGPRFFGTMRALGLEKGWFEALAPGLPGPEVCKKVAEALTGRIIVADLVQENYEAKNEMRNRLSAVVQVLSAPAAGGAGVPAVPAAVPAPAAVAPVAAVPAPAPVAVAVAPVAPVAVAPPVVEVAPVAPVVPVVAAPVVAAPAAPVVEAPVIAAVAAPVVPAVPVVAQPAPAAAPTDDDPGF